MKKSQLGFRGEIPRISAVKLPDGYGESAVNARLLSGDLGAWQNFDAAITLSKAAPINTIYYLAETYWLEWNDSELGSGAVCVDVARGIIPGDTTYRTYLTGLDAPRFTNISLASTGAPPYPAETRLLGVIAPTSAPTPVVNTAPVTGPAEDLLLRNVVDAGDNLSGWIYSGSVISGTPAIGSGNPPPCYIMTINLPDDVSPVGALPCYMYRDFGVGSDAVVLFETDFRAGGSAGHPLTLNSGWHVMVGALGAGPMVSWATGAANAGTLHVGTTNGWGGAINSIGSVAVSGLSFGWYRMSISMVKNSDGTSTMTAKIKSGSTVLAEVVMPNAGPLGGLCGMQFLAMTSGISQAAFDNILVQSRGSTSGTPTTPGSTSTTATSYVFTFVNDFGEESAPSPASVTVLRPDGVTVTVTTATAPPTGPDYNIETKRIYRAVTGATGTSFQFVAEIALGTADYDDSLTDLQLGEILQSDNWDLPPSDLRGILALPNGIMVGFRRNQLCFSVQNHPHAWPVEFRLNTDTDIVAIGAIDTSVVIATNAFPYIASGNNPASYSMSKLEVPQACVSKRGLTYLAGTGVVYPSPDGLIAISGPGRPVNLTEALFTREEWQALNPESIIATAHDDRYWASYAVDEDNKAGFALDAKQTGFGKITLAFHATAVFADPISDILYLVLDENEEPSDVLGDVPEDVPAPGNIVYAFNSDADVKLSTSYVSKLWQLEAPTTFGMAQIKARDYDNLVAKFYADGDLYYSKRILDSREFVIPPVPVLLTFQVQIVGTSQVTQIEVVEDVEELG